VIELLTTAYEKLTLEELVVLARHHLKDADEMVRREMFEAARNTLKHIGAFIDAAEKEYMALADED